MAIDKRYLLVVAAMCGLSMATVGLITNIAGLFFIPMAEEYGVLQGVASLTLTIANICVAVGGLATRKLTKLMSLKALLIAGAAVLAGSNLGTAFSPNIGITYALSVTKGLAGGVVGFVLITYVLNKWFQKKLGLVTSIAMGCSGLAGAIFTPIVQPVVQNMGWRAGQVLVSVFMVLLCLPAILFVPSCDPKDAGLVPFGESKTVASSVSQDKCASIRVNKMLAALVFLYAVLAAAVSSMPQHFPGLAVEAGSRPYGGRWGGNDIFLHDCEHCGKNCYGMAYRPHWRTVFDYYLYRCRLHVNNCAACGACSCGLRRGGVLLWPLLLACNGWPFHDVSRIIRQARLWHCISRGRARVQLFQRGLLVGGRLWLRPNRRVYCFPYNFFLLSRWFGSSCGLVLQGACVVGAAWAPFPAHPQRGHGVDNGLSPPSSLSIVRRPLGRRPRVGGGTLISLPACDAPPMLVLHPTSIASCRLFNVRGLARLIKVRKGQWNRCAHPAV